MKERVRYGCDPEFNLWEWEPRNMKGEVILITGGGRGTGEAIARMAAGLEANVVIAARTRKEIEKVANEIGGLGVVADVSKEKDVKTLFRVAKKRFGKIDFLVNNAGYITCAPIEEVSVEEWQKHVDVNLTGSFLCAREFFRLMKNKSGGVIVNISSSATTHARPNWSAYSISKSGVEQLTHFIVAEGEKYGIKSFTIRPSRTDTIMRRRLYPNEDRESLLLPREVAKLVLFCCSEDISFLPGQAIGIKRV